MAGSMVKAVLFDFGGTLVQPKKSWAEIRREGVKATYDFLTKRGMKKPFADYAAVEEGVFRKYAKREAAEDRDIPAVVRYREVIGKLLPSWSRLERLRLASKTNDVFWAVAARAQTPSRGVHRALKKLRSMGMRMAVVSNHHNGDSLRGMLRTFRMKQYFDAVIASSEAGARKPDPRIFRLCLSRLRLKRDRTVFIGDSLLYDVAGAIAAGLISILYIEGAPEELEAPRDRDGVETVRNPGVEPDFILGDFDSLPRVLAALS